ncbi:uncharacterized protein L969DRAFT_42506, partial [Mixia osmundae IAM 14324]
LLSASLSISFDFQDERQMAQEACPSCMSCPSLPPRLPLTWSLGFSSNVRGEKCAHAPRQAHGDQLNDRAWRLELACSLSKLVTDDYGSPLARRCNDISRHDLLALSTILQESKGHALRTGWSCMVLSQIERRSTLRKTPKDVKKEFLFLSYPNCSLTLVLARSYIH